jgi:hypothetical protein
MQTRSLPTHLRAHGVTRDSTEAEIAEAVRVQRLIEDHRRRGGLRR